MIDKTNNTGYTIDVYSLVDAIAGDSSEQNSLYQQAADYFRNEPANRQKLKKLKTEIKGIRLSLETESDKSAKVLEQQLQYLSKEYEAERLNQQAVRLQRLDNAIDVCLALLSLTEGENFDETQFKSSKFLTSLVLFSPNKGKKLAELHHKLKPAYKAVLSLRVLDKLVGDGVLKNTYILKEFNAEKRYEAKVTNSECYTQAVILPIMLSAIFQDVGLQHPQLIELLEGKEGDKDRFRLLEKEEREEMLSLSYQFTIDYLKNGLGCQQSCSEDEDERVEFDKAEEKRLKFQLGLVLDANSSKLGTSEIIKIPQIYASVVFSTKRDYERRNLPTASILISQLAVKKMLSPKVAEVFVSIVGQFPLGFGIAYVAQDIGGNDLDYYEYAIVSGLNPTKIDEPICRLVTKNLMFLPHGKNDVIVRERNLYFQVARKKLVKISHKRLAEVMEKLAHNYRIEENKSIIPYYWEPHEYFCVQGNQRLWSHTR